MQINATKWSQVQFKDILTYVSDIIPLDDTEEYTTITVKRYHGGLETREQLSGSQIITKKQYSLIPGAFIISRVQCWHEAYAIVPDEIKTNMIASTNYDQFVISPAVDKRFFWWLSFSPIFTQTIRDCAFGVVIEKMVFNRDAWLNKSIFLPPLEEQRRIVARIEELTGKIEEARGLRQEAAENVEVLLTNARNAFIKKIPTNQWFQLKSFVKKIENGWSPNCENRPAQKDEWGVLKLGAVSFGVFNETENKVLPSTLEAKTEYEVKSGDFLMSRANTLSLVGACAIVGETRSQLMLCDKIFRFIFNEENPINHQYLEQVLKSSFLRTQIEQNASGTSPTMKNISKDKVLELRIPNCSLSEQLEIVEALDKIQKQVGALKNNQAESAAELDALLPSILDKAFKGEL